MSDRIEKCDGDHGGPRCGDPECWNDSPVPPAGDVEVLGYADKDGQLCVPEFVEGPYVERFSIELVDRAHVTLLTAENARLHAENEANRYEREVCCDNFERVQAELTKARELNSVAADDLHQANVRAILAEEQLVQYQCRHEWIDNGEDLLVCPKCGKEDSDPEPFGWVQTSGPSINRFTQEWDVVQEWSDNGYEWVELFEGDDHQSAPAAKGDIHEL